MKIRLNREIFTGTELMVIISFAAIAAIIVFTSCLNCRKNVHHVQAEVSQHLTSREAKQIQEQIDFARVLLNAYEASVTNNIQQ